MSTHASDILSIVQDALDCHPSIHQVIVFGHTPNPHEGFPNRDGRYELSIMPRDTMRSFRVSIAAAPTEDHYDVEPLA